MFIVEIKRGQRACVIARGFLITEVVVFDCANPRSRSCPLFDLLPLKTCKELGLCTSFPFPQLHLFDVGLLQRWNESCVHQSTLVDMDAQLKSIHSWPS